MVMCIYYNRCGSGWWWGCWLVVGVMGGEGFVCNILFVVVVDDKVFVLLLWLDCCNFVEDIVFIIIV